MKNTIPALVTLFLFWFAWPSQTQSTGPQGPPGAQGNRGPRGWKGAPGNGLASGVPLASLPVGSLAIGPLSDGTYVAVQIVNSTTATVQAKADLNGSATSPYVYSDAPNGPAILASCLMDDSGCTPGTPTAGTPFYIYSNDGGLKIWNSIVTVP